MLLVAVASTATLFPYTTLFRSVADLVFGDLLDRPGVDRGRPAVDRHLDPGHHPAAVQVGGGEPLGAGGVALAAVGRARPVDDGDVGFGGPPLPADRDLLEGQVGEGLVPLVEGAADDRQRGLVVAAERVGQDSVAQAVAPGAADADGLAVTFRPGRPAADREPSG